MGDLYFNRVYKMLGLVIKSMNNIICTNKDIDNLLNFQLFGVDIAVSQDLEPQIMEINKGPDLGAKVVKILPGKNHGFVPVLI